MEAQSPVTDSAPPDVAPRAAEVAEEHGGRTFEHRALLVLSQLGLFAFLMLGLFVQPDERGFGTHEKLGMRPCLPMAVWNVPCPGCGVTTSVTLAARGRFFDSIANQPFGFLFALGLLAFGLFAPVVHFRRRDLSVLLAQVPLRIWGSVAALVVVASWAYKIWRLRG